MLHGDIVMDELLYVCADYGNGLDSLFVERVGRCLPLHRARNGLSQARQRFCSRAPYGSYLGEGCCGGKIRGGSAGGPSLGAEVFDMASECPCRNADAARRHLRVRPTVVVLVLGDYVPDECRRSRWPTNGDSMFPVWSGKSRTCF